jgi:hypothetical protein
MTLIKVFRNTGCYIEAQNGETATAGGGRGRGGEDGGGEGDEDAGTLPFLTLEDGKCCFLMPNLSRHTTTRRHANGEAQRVCARMESRRLMTEDQFSPL